MAMENVYNTSENYGKCLHSAIYSEGNTELVYRKAYKGDWGDWDEQPDSTTITEPNRFDSSGITISA